MSVYVDDMYAPYFNMKMCHMTADTLEELHAMAFKIGVRRKWFQDHDTPHYDICMAKRKMAVYHGAIQETVREGIKRRKTVGHNTT